MINPKNDLYRNEWLELVFSGRNKMYGAYELRQHNGLTSMKGLVAGSSLLLLAVVSPFIYSKLNSGQEIVSPLPPDEVLKITEYTLPAKPVKPEPTSPPAPKQEPVKVPAQKFVTMKVVPAPEVQAEAPSMKELEGKTIGLQTVEGDPTEGVLNTIEPVPTSAGQGNATAASDEPVRFEMLEKYPEFPGGQDAFYKYIGRNLRYPASARENEISGRVIVSFVIERNGSLSDIKIVRGIGGGCDEEAIRVLKKSPAWTSGMQNGQKVRVAYTMPIAFRLSE